MQGEGAGALLEPKVCRGPPGLELLSASLVSASCKVKVQPTKAAIQQETCPSPCTSYRSVAARAVKEELEVQEKTTELQEGSRGSMQNSSRGRGGSSRSADKQLKEGKGRRTRGGGAKDAGSSLGNSKQGDRRQHAQERRLQDEIKASCPLPKLDESLENPQELLKLKTLFVGELDNGQPRRRPPIDPETGRLMYWDRRCYSFDSEGAACASGVQCIFCHTTEELLLHPARFRSELMAPGGENAWHCATSIAELRSRAPEAYGLDSHLRRLQNAPGQESTKPEKSNKHAAEKAKNQQTKQAPPQQPQKKPQAKQQRQQQQQQQQQSVRQTTVVTQPKPKHALGEDIRACSSSSTEVNSIEDSCGSSSGCCSGGDCGVLCEFTPAASPLPAGADDAVLSRSDSDQNKDLDVEADPGAEMQVSSEPASALHAVKEVPASSATSSGRNGGDAEASMVALSTKGTRLAYPWSEQEGALNLSSFKVFPCRHKHSLSHDKKYCPFYHNFRDKRRFPVTYRAEQCEKHFDLDSSSLRCSKGDACDKSHNRHELLYHPSIFKQRFCSSYATRNGTERCGRGQFCAFAHSREELRAPLFTVAEETNPTTEFFMQHFKTVWCPYGVQHDWYTCVYAHTYQDCRRSPQVGYGSEPCPAWNKDVHSADYGRRCPHGTLCPYSHGSKEQLYHPSYYKTMPCMDYRARDRGGVSCPRGSLCAFYHEASERRWPVRVTVDYSAPLPLERNALLQAQFLRPPLFNLDDFEAFGHTSRKTASRKEIAAPETTTGRGARAGCRRVESGNMSCTKSPPPPIVRKHADQPGGQGEHQASCNLGDHVQQEPRDGTQQSQVLLMHRQGPQEDAPHSQLLLMQQPFSPLGEFAQSSFQVARASSFPNGLVFKQQQQQSQQQYAEAKAPSLPSNFTSLAAGSSQWPVEAHQRRLSAVDLAGQDANCSLFEDLGIGLSTTSRSSAPHPELPQAQQQKLLQLQKLEETKQQKTLHQLATGLSASGNLSNSGGFNSWLLKRFADERITPRLTEGLPGQGSRPVTAVSALLKQQAPGAQPITQEQKLLPQHNMRASMETGSATETTAALWRPLGETASLGGQVICTPRPPDDVQLGRRNSVIAAPQMTCIRSLEGSAVRTVGLFDSSGVWGAAQPELYLTDRRTFGSAVDLQEIISKAEGLDSVPQLTCKTSHTADSRFSTQGRGSTLTTGEELSESAARLPPVPPPSLHWYCRQAPAFNNNSPMDDGGRLCGSQDALSQQSEFGVALSRAAGGPCEEAAWMSDSFVGEDMSDERLFNSAMSLQRLLTFDVDSTQEQLKHQRGSTGAPFTFSLGVGLSAAEGNYMGSRGLENGLLGTQLASVYLVTPAVAQQERVLLRIVRAKTSPKMLLLHNAAHALSLKAELQSSAAKVGYSVTTWGETSDGEVNFWDSPGASLGLRQQPRDSTEVAELLEKAAACGFPVFMLYVHSSEKELGEACSQLASYFVSAPVLAAQKRLFLLHLCLTAPPSTMSKQLLQHVVTLSLPCLKHWSALLCDDQQELDTALAMNMKTIVPPLEQRKQQQQQKLSSEADSANVLGKDCKERRFLSAEELRTAVSPTYSVYSLPCMHEDLQWNDESGQATEENRSSLQRPTDSNDLLISVLRQELENSVASSTEGAGSLRNPPCVLLEVNESPAVVAPPPGLPARPLNGLRRSISDDVYSAQGPLQQMIQEVASLGFTLLQEDRTVKAWSQQLGASLAVGKESEACSLEQQPHSWARGGVQRLAFSRTTAVLFRKKVVREDYDLLDAFRLLAEAQSAAGDCRGIMRCVRAICPNPAAPADAGAAVYLQPPANARAAEALWVGSLQQLVSGNGPVAVVQKEQAQSTPRGNDLGQEHLLGQATMTTPCCVCGCPIETAVPRGVACVHRHHSSCGEVLRAGGCWPCPCTLLWPTPNSDNQGEQDAVFPSHALRHMVLDLCDAVTEAYGLLQHIHAAAYGHSERQRGICFALGPQDVIVSASCDGVLSICIDVASPKVLRSAMLPSACPVETTQDSLGAVLGKLVSFLLTRGRASNPRAGGTPLVTNLLGTLWSSSPGELQLCRTHPFFWSSAERLSFLQVALALMHLPQSSQQDGQQQREGVESSWGAKLAAQLEGLCCTGRSWLLAKACRNQSLAGDAFTFPPALAILTLVDKLRQRWLSFSGELSSQEVQVLLKEVGLGTSPQQKQQQHRLLLVQHADEALARHMETEVPELLLSVFLLARAEPAVLEMMHASPSLTSLRPALNVGSAEGR
ncbi:hypothetical protein Efla_001859 [Eimeria flavescens]